MRSGYDGATPKLNGDSLEYLPEDFYTASVAAGRPSALEAESGGTVQSQAWSTMGWGYWGGAGDGNYTGGGGGSWPFAPAVDKCLPSLVWLRNFSRRDGAVAPRIVCTP